MFLRIFRRPKIGTWNAGNYREHWRLVYLFVFWNRQKWTFCFSCVFYGRFQTIEEGVTRFVIFSGCCAVGLERCILERPRVGGFGGAFQPRKYISLVRACKNCCSSTGWTSHNNGHSLAFFLPATAMTGIFGGLCSKITGKKGSPLTWTLFCVPGKSLRFAAIYCDEFGRHLWTIPPARLAFPFEKICKFMQKCLKNLNFGGLNEFWRMKFDIKSRNWWICVKFCGEVEFDVLNLMADLEF